MDVSPAMGVRIVASPKMGKIEDGTNGKVVVARCFRWEEGQKHSGAIGKILHFGSFDDIVSHPMQAFNFSFCPSDFALFLYCQSLTPYLFLL